MDWLEEIGSTTTALDPNKVGRKGWRLLEMAEIEAFNVPGGAVVRTPLYEEVADQTDLEWIDNKGDIKLEVIGENPSNSRLNEIHEETKQEFLKAELPSEFKQELHETLSKYEQAPDTYDRKFVVRSNAVNEDRADASGAGKMKSIDSSDTFNQITNSIKIVYASAYSPSAINNLNSEENSLEKFGGQGVVIQEQVQPKAGMIIDSKDIVKQGTVKVEVDKTPWDVADGAASDIYNVNRNNNAIEYENNDKTPEILGRQKVREAANLAQSIELAFGNQPMDIEAAISQEDETIQIVQARPITGDFSARSPYERDELPQEFQENHLAYSTNGIRGIGVAQAPAVVMSYADTSGEYAVKREGLPEDLQNMEDEELLIELNERYSEGYIAVTEVANEEITEITTNKVAYVAPNAGASCHASRAAAEEDILYLGATENQVQEEKETGDILSLAVNQAANTGFGELAEGQILEQNQEVYTGDGSEIT